MRSSLPVYVCVHIVYEIALPLESNIKTKTTEEKTVWLLSLALGSGKQLGLKISFKITDYAIKKQLTCFKKMPLKNLEVNSNHVLKLHSPLCLKLQLWFNY